MQFFSDLDGLTVFLTGLSVILVVLVLRLLSRAIGSRGWNYISTLLVIPMWLAVICGFFAYRAYCPDADQPHIQTTGTINQFKVYRYSFGKHSTRTGALECVGPCGPDVPLIAFKADNTGLVASRNPSAPLSVTYLGRTEQAATNDGDVLPAHPVVEIDDAATGARLFFVDTVRHWPRTIIRLADALVCMIPFVVCWFRAS